MLVLHPLVPPPVGAMPAEDAQDSTSEILVVPLRGTPSNYNFAVKGGRNQEVDDLGSSHES